MAAITSAPPGRTNRRPARRGRWTPYLLLLPGMLWLVVFFVVPTVSLASQSLQTGNIDDGYVLTWNVQIYADAVKQYWPHFARSIGYAASATVLSLLLGYPLAYFMAQKAGRWKNVLLVLVIAPFFTNFLIRTLAWQIILTDTGSVAAFARWSHLTTVLQWVGLTNNDQLMSSTFAVITGLTYNFLPFMVLPLYASLEKIDYRLIEASSDLYASPIRGFFKVTWPLSMPGVVAGTLLTFIPSAGDYINAQLLGSPNQRMVGNVIQNLFTTSNDYAAAGALSMILMLIIVAMVLLYVRKSGTEELI